MRMVQYYAQGQARQAGKNQDRIIHDAKTHDGAYSYLTALQRAYSVAWAG